MACKFLVHISNSSVVVRQRNNVANYNRYLNAILCCQRKQSHRTRRNLSTRGDQFNPRTALVLSKFSRYEYEKRRHPTLSEDELKDNLKRRKERSRLAKRGSDYSMLIHHHLTHLKYCKLVVDTLIHHGIETKVVDRFEYTDENIEKADVVFTAGGDGTFLMAASKILDRDKPVIGINSDPSRSLGYLCLPSKYTFHFPEALQKLLSGKFKWSCRQRIRISMTGRNALDQPIELHDQQLLYPEYRFIDCYQEEQYNMASVTKSKDSNLPSTILPVRALNEVFIGESLSSRTSYYEVSVDGSNYTKQRSSGFTASTGTGSTSWHLNTNKLTNQDVQDLLKIMRNITGKSMDVDGRTINRITDTFNGSLIFDPSEQQMAYTIRDPQHFGMNEWDIPPRGFVNHIHVKSRCFDACLVIDGGLSFVFNDGAMAELEILPADALKTVVLCEDDEKSESLRSF